MSSPKSGPSFHLGVYLGLLFIFSLNLSHKLPTMLTLFSDFQYRFTTKLAGFGCGYLLTPHPPSSALLDIRSNGGKKEDYK